jgi:hypothetical protein
MKYKIQKIKLLKIISEMLLNKNCYLGSSFTNSNDLGNANLSQFQEYPEETSKIIKSIFCSIGIDAESKDNYLINYCTKKQENLNYFYYLFELFLNKKKFSYKNTKQNIIYNENLMKIIFMYLNNSDRSVFSDNNNKNFFNLLNIQDIYNLTLVNIFFREKEQDNEEKERDLNNFILNNLYQDTYTFDGCNSHNSFQSPFANLYFNDISEKLLKIVTEPILYLASKIYQYDYVNIIHKKIYQEHEDIPEPELWRESYIYKTDDQMRKNIKTKVYLCMYNNSGKYNIFHMLESSFMFLLNQKILEPQFN